jgi:hypothetical protein
LLRPQGLAREALRPPFEPAAQTWPRRAARRFAHCRVAAVDLEVWRAKAESDSATLPDLMRAAVHERNRQVARIGNDLNQIARWVNRYPLLAPARQRSWRPQGRGRGGSMSMATEMSHST